jgi:hypothetical protein
LVNEVCFSHNLNFNLRITNFQAIGT